MELKLDHARDLLVGSMRAINYDANESACIADHLLDCELRGLGYAGLARALTIVEYVRKLDLNRTSIRVRHETPLSAKIDGGNNVGYVVASQATTMAIAKAKAQGIAIVGAARTYYTGMFSYYLERLASEGLCGMIAGSGLAVVAPFGGTEARFCTNPIAFGFPTDDVPLIWDIGTSSITHAEVVLARRRGEPLPEGLAFDAQGQPTTDPDAVLSGGALTVWGGHRGSGLALSVQVLSMLAGQVNMFKPSDDPIDCGFFLLAFDPGLFGSADDFRTAVSEYIRILTGTRPVDPAKPVRAPFARSVALRRERMRSGVIEVPDLVVEKLRAIGGAP
ncbi:dehydrogenase [Mesorhizobium sp. L-8-10]|uniref:Ldh family oxidoreductase n=1 Tax=Mesorhizobium sp. L-8-10 TaxID=2744523 RepID=UPI001925DDDC|nr:Ldh family oxidoreductase [Mesorhizobium sp. L-8-10]BCH29794.1 dehydrogenase [Mesorhizobium sp. L-8-10]